MYWYTLTSVVMFVYLCASPNLMSGFAFVISVGWWFVHRYEMILQEKEEADVVIK